MCAQASEEPKSSCEDEEIISGELILNYTWKGLDQAGIHLARLESKATTLAGFTGLSATIILGILRATWSKTDVLTPSVILMQGLILLLSIFIIGAFAFCVVSLWPRPMKRMPPKARFVGKYIALNNRECTPSIPLRKEIIEQIGAIEAGVYEVVAMKEKWMLRAIKIFACAVAITGLILLIYLSKLICTLST